MVEHTLRPWRYSCSAIEPNLCRIEYDDPHQPPGFARLVMHVGVGGVDSGEEATANMRLAATAPDLLEALEAMRENYYDIDSRCLALADAAIAKAKGE